MGVGGLCELFYVKNGEGRICDGLAENGLCVGTEGGIQFLLAAVGGNEGEFDAHTLHGDCEKVESAAVNAGGGHNVVAAGGDVKNSVEVGGLSGGGEHGCAAAFESRYLCRNIVVGGVLQTAVKIAGGLKVKKLAHLGAGSIFESGALDNGDLAGLTVAGGVAGLHTFGTDFVFCHNLSLLTGRICRFL